jgi:hypothetical protein
MPRDDARAALAARQAAVVRAILDGAPPPPDFAPGALAVARQVVTHKRAALAQLRPPRGWRRLLAWLGRRAR